MTSNVRPFTAAKRATTLNMHEQKGAVQTTLSAPDYTTRVPLPPDGAGLTRSQRLFTISTGVHVDSLTIARGDKFFLFMKLRAQHQWASFRMTAPKWVEATKAYNAELELANRSHNRNSTLKNPRALAAMLGTVEATITNRLIAGNYRCEPAPSQAALHFACPFSLSRLAKKGSEAFWREHCHAVPLLKEGHLDRTRKVCPRPCSSVLEWTVLIRICPYRRRVSPPRAQGARRLCTQAPLDHPKTTSEGTARTA